MESDQLDEMGARRGVARGAQPRSYLRPYAVILARAELSTDVVLYASRHSFGRDFRCALWRRTTRLCR